MTETMTGAPPTAQSTQSAQTEAPPAFTTLSEAEQRAVAERLLRIEESGWRPFWCADPHCSGDPHRKVFTDPDTGEEYHAFADPADKTGPEGEPLGEVVAETLDGGEVEVTGDLAVEVTEDMTVLGRPILDPKWSHNHARTDQRLPSWLKPWILFIMSGRGCVAPWTLIDLADGTRERIDVLAERGEAVEVMTPDGPRWTDGAPFMKGVAHMWRVRLSTGRVLTVTDKHRFLAPGGWLTLDYVRVGQPLVSAEPAQPSSVGRSSSAALSGWREGAQRCWSTELGSGCGCPTCRRRGDLPLPSFPETARGGAPSPDGASGPDRGPSRSGGPGHGRGCSRACLRAAHLTRKGCAQCAASLADGRSRTEPSLVVSSPRTQETAAPSQPWTALAQPTPAGQPPRVGSEDDPSLAPSRLLRAAASLRSALTHRVQRRVLAQSEPLLRNERSDLVWVESVEYSHFGPFYDMSVPGPQSYISEGVVSHNTGKTRTGVEFVALSARKGLDGAIIGRRGTELINTHVAAIMEHAHPEFTPEYQASKDILVWPNEAITYLFSAERPENIRSVNLSYFWMDEAAFMPEVETAWMNARLATRIEKPGNPIHILITSTPTSTPWVMKMEDDPNVEVRRVSTYANRRNLSPDFLQMLTEQYEGTRMGRQELHGEVLRDVEGALWNDDLFDQVHTDAVGFGSWLDSMDDRVVAVDPAGSKGPRSDATGIIGVGAQHTDDDDNPIPTQFTVLADATLKGSPTEWAEQVFKAARLIRASRIIAEKNFGGDMVKQVLNDYAELHPGRALDHEGEPFKIEVVHAVLSKETRAEATVGKYEQGRVKHLSSPTVFGDLSKLETEQTMWVPKSRGGRSPSPNRVDALVWAIRELESKVRFVGAMAGSRQVMERLKRNR